MKRVLSSIPTAVALIVLAALYGLDVVSPAETLVVAALYVVVDVASRVLGPQLQRLRANAAAVRARWDLVRMFREVGASWLEAFALSRRPAIAGGALTESAHPAEFLMADWGRSREKLTVLSGQNLKAGAVVGRVAYGVGRASVPTVVGTGNGTMTGVYAGPEIEKGNYVVTCSVAAANGGTFTVTAPSGKALPTATVGTDYRSRHINFKINDGATDFVVGDVFTIIVGTTAPVVVGTGNGTISGLSLGPDAKPGHYRVVCIEAITNGGAFEVVGPDGDVVAVGYIVAGAGGTLALADQRQLNLTITDSTTDFAVGDVFNVAVFNELTKKVVAWDPLTFDGRSVAAGVLYEAVDASSADKDGVIIARDAEVRDAALIYAAAITAAQKVSAKADLAALGIVAR